MSLSVATCNQVSKRVEKHYRRMQCPRGVLLPYCSVGGSTTCKDEKEFLWRKWIPSSILKLKKKEETGKMHLFSFLHFRRTDIKDNKVNCRHSVIQEATGRLWLWHEIGSENENSAFDRQKKSTLFVMAKEIFNREKKMYAKGYGRVTPTSDNC